MYAHYLSGDRKIFTSFVGLLEVPSGSASTIFSALRKLVRKILDNRLIAFASDGALL